MSPWVHTASTLASSQTGGTGHRASAGMPGAPPSSSSAGTHAGCPGSALLVPEKRSALGCKGRWRRTWLTVQTDNGQPSAEVQPQTQPAGQPGKTPTTQTCQVWAVTAPSPPHLGSAIEEATAPSPVPRHSLPGDPEPLLLWGLPSAPPNPSDGDPAPAHLWGCPAAPTQASGTCTGHLAPKGLGLTEATFSPLWFTCPAAQGPGRLCPPRLRAEILTPW